MKTKFHTLAVGVTGGLGSGKSAVCKFFESIGAQVLSADLIARDLMNSQADIRRQLKKTFGEKIYLLDGTIDRKHLAKLAFHENNLHEKLNQIVHPYVLDAIGQEIARQKEAGRSSLLLVEAALIFEAHADELFDYVLVVDADEEVRVRRVMTRDGSHRDEVLARIKAQMPVKDKVTMADFVILNSGGEVALKKKCTFMYDLLVRIAQTESAKTD